MLRRGIALAITAGSLVLTSSQPTATRVVAPRESEGGPAKILYPATSKEAYLTQDQFDFARPGIVYKINSVTIGADRKPVIDVTITDTLGAPVDRLGIQTPGVVTASFVLSWYDPATRNYTSYATRTATAAPPAPPDRIGKTAVQATGLSGSVVDLELGHFKFNAWTARSTLTTPSSTSGPTARPSRRSGTRSRRRTPATSATTRLPPTAMFGRTPNSASSATRPRRPTRTRAISST